MKAWRLTQPQKVEIVEAIQTGQSTMTKLAKKYGTSIATISYHYRTRTGNQVKPQNVLSQADKETVIEELDAGQVRTLDLAKKYGVSKMTIQRAYKQITGHAFHPRLPSATKEAIVQEVQMNEGVSRKDIIAKYGIHPTTFERIVKKATGKTYSSFTPRLVIQKSQSTPRNKQSAKLTQQQKETIVAPLQTGEATQAKLAKRFDVDQPSISYVYKHQTGTALLPRLSDSQRNALAIDMMEEKMTREEIAQKYNVYYTSLSQIFRRQTGYSRTELKSNINIASYYSQYRAWHHDEKNMYTVLGVDWLKRKILITQSFLPEWVAMERFTLMLRSMLLAKSGQELYEGDIVRFPILLQEEHETEAKKKTLITDVVTIDKEKGWLIYTSLNDPLCLHNDECEVIGNIYQHPELKNADNEHIFPAIQEGHAMTF